MAAGVQRWFGCDLVVVELPKIKRRSVGGWPVATTTRELRPREERIFFIFDSN